jgi:hypothetical protein
MNNIKIYFIIIDTCHSGEKLRSLYRSIANLRNIDEKIVPFDVENARNMCNAINFTGFNLINSAAQFSLQFMMQLAIIPNNKLS